MLPTALSATDPECLRRRYRVVRRDTMTALPGLILAANTLTGLAMMRLDNGEVQEFALGADSLRIVGR